MKHLLLTTIVKGSVLVVDK